MPKDQFPIPQPLKGLSDNVAFGYQEPGTTRRSANIRSIDPVTGRTRIAQRAGLSRFIFPDAQLSGSNKVQDLNSITVNNNLLTYADANSGATEQVFAKDLSTLQRRATDMRRDAFGCIYVAMQNGGVDKYNGDGTLVATAKVPNFIGDGSTKSEVAITGFDVDQFQNIYIAVGDNLGGTDAIGRLYAFEALADGTYKQAWLLETGNYFADVAVFEKNLYCLENTAAVSATETAATHFAYFTYYPNVSICNSPAEDVGRRVQLDIGDTTNDVMWGRRITVAPDGSAYCAIRDPDAVVTTTRAQLVKVNPFSQDPTAVQWYIANYTDGSADVDETGGIGQGVIMGPVDTLGNPTVYSVGPGGPTDTNELRRIVDDEGVPDVATGDSWEASITSWRDDDVYSLRMAVDVNDNVYVPSTVASGDHVLIYDEDGTELNSFENANATHFALCCAVPATNPTYQAGGPEEAEFCWFGTNQTTESFYKQRLVSSTLGTGAMRTLVRVGVANGDIVTFTGSAVTSPTGGSSALDGTSEFVQSSALGRRLYFVDGTNYKKYDGDDAEVTDWTSESIGGIPPRCRLIATWRGRIVLARDPEDPQLWHMSAVGDAENWDNFPPVPTVAQAISGVNAKAGKVPDIVTSIIPWDDDLCLFGGDKSIWRMTGDPLAGGQFDLLTDETGTAFGQCWAKDPVGSRLFFFGSRGGVYMMERNSLPIRISRDRIERRLQAVDLGSFYIRMIWNYEDEGLHVFQLPYGSGGTQVNHWFWDAKNNAWHEDQYGTSSDTDPQPTSVFLYDGDDPDDRVILFGCEDGRIRKWDKSSNVDQGATTDINIAAEVTIGPLMPPDAPYETRFTGFTAVLARDQSGCSYRFYAQDEPDSLEQPVAEGRLFGGRNATQSVRFRASNAWLSLSNVTDQRFAVENMRIGIAAAGRMRVR